MTPLVNNTKTIILKTHECDVQNMPDTSTSKPLQHTSVHIQPILRSQITTTCVDHLIKNNTHFMKTQFIASISCKQSIITFSTGVINLVTVTVTQEIVYISYILAYIYHI